MTFTTSVYNVIQRLGYNSATVVHDGFTTNEGIVHVVETAKPVGLPAKELLVKDLLPELEQATDIKQRIETVRKPVVPSVPAPQVDWSMLGNPITGANTTKSWVTLASTVQQQAYVQMMGNALQNARRRPWTSNDSNNWA